MAVPISQSEFSDADAAHMRRAIALSLGGRGRVEPNPMVGAVVVRDGRVIGEGAHRRFGGPHAEVEALAACTEGPAGATLYVTLEPCCHFGKTPPCTQAILRAGLNRVVFAVEDPFPKVAGGGKRELAAAGLQVQGGLLAAEAVRAKRRDFSLRLRGRPYVIAKWAQTLDGKLATAAGDSKWISGELSRRRVHELRDRVDAVLIGIGTALADDPLLTARIPNGRSPRRIVLDRRLRLPLSSQLARTAREVPLTLVCDPGETGSPAAAALRSAGAEVIVAADLPALLGELGRREITNLLVEGGTAILTAFLEAGLVDEAQVFIAPKLVGGAAAPTAFAGAGIPKMADAVTARETEIERIGDDLLITARFGDPAAWAGLEEPRNDYIRADALDQIEYYRLGEMGFFDRRHVELIEGEIVESRSPTELHCVVRAIVVRELQRSFGRKHWVRQGGPLSVTKKSDPEPDAAVVPGRPDDYAHFKKGHPSQAILIVEVAATSLKYDRTTKASVYAKAGVADYWLVNVKERTLEIRRKPVRDASQRFGYGYAETSILSIDESATPLALPKARIPVKSFFPKA